MQTPYVHLLKRVQVPFFFLLSLIIAWSIWLPQAAVALGLRTTALPFDSPLMLIPVWGPGLAAILVTLLTAGRAGLRALFRPLRTWRVGLHWYLVTLFFPAAIWLAGRAMDTLLGATYTLRSPLASFGPQAALMLPVLILFAFPSALGEELGWRGFALPHLQNRYTALVASVVLGLFWGLWHIPTLIAQGALDSSIGAIGLSMVATIPLAVLYTWLFNNTGQSLLLVWLFHTSDAITQYLLPRLLTATDDLLILGAAVLVVILAGPTHLSRHMPDGLGRPAAIHQR